MSKAFPSLFNLKSRKFRLVEGNVEEMVTPEIMDGVSAVVHLAAIADPERSIAQPTLVREHNVRGTRRVVEMCLLQGTPIVFPSTTSVYGGVDSAICESTAVLSPSTPYAQCKLEEEAIVAAGRAQGLPAITLRLGTIFGPSMGMRFHTAVNRFCWQAVTGRPITVFRNAMNETRPYLYVGDAAEAIAKIVSSAQFSGEVVNLATTNATVAEVVEGIRSVVAGLSVDVVEARSAGRDSFGVSTEKAERLGISFRGDLREGIKETIHLLEGLRP